MSETIINTGTFIQFVDECIPRKMKTHIFRVETKANFLEGTGDEVILGTVRWFGQWRAYSFFPNTQTVFENTCLREIANFCEDMTAAHRLSAGRSKQ